MKTSGEPTVAMAYDPVELRRCIAVSFSAPELRRLTEELGVAGQIGWDRGHDEAARALVRQFERYYGLETLVESLRARRPLVEWPEAQPVGTPAAQMSLDATVAAPGHLDAPIALGALPAPIAPTVPALPGAPALPPLSASPGSFGAPPLSASPGSFGAPPLSASPGSFGAPRAAATALDDGPILPDPMIPLEPAATAGRPPPGWAGIEAASAEARPGKSPRRLLWAGAATAFVALAALLAFAAGRASTKEAAPPPTEASAATSSPVGAEGAAEEGSRPSPSARAALALARALAAVGRVCELPPSTPRDAAMLARALEQCGPAPLIDRPLTAPARRAPPPHAEPNDAPERPRAPRAPDPSPRAPTSTERPCIRSCDAALQTCKGRCGAEPTESRKYEGYQLCQSRCLSTASRCRLACP